MKSEEVQPETRTYRGWKVLVGGFIAGMVPVGAIQYSYGLFVVPVSDELGLSRADANNGLIAMGIGATVMSPFIGRIIDRYSIRLVMAVGALLLAAGYFAIAQTSSPWVIVLIALGPLALAQDSAGGMPANTLAARWFRRRRGRAMGIIGAAPSAGGFILAPVAGFLIVWLGWRSALAVLGLGAAAILLLAAIFLVRSRPDAGELEKIGELGSSDTDSDGHVDEHKVWGYRELLTDRSFLLLVVGTGMLLASDRAILISIAPYLADQGIDLQMAAFMVSALTGSALLGKLVVGYLADFVDARRLFYAVAALHVVLLVLFIMAPPYWVLMSASLIVGVGIGGVLTVTQVLIASLFGSGSYGTILGVAGMILQILMLSALRFIGEVRDRTGSYELAFEVFMIFVACSIFLVWMIRPERGMGKLQAQTIVRS